MNSLFACREDARFVYKRTPEDIRQSSPELAAAFALLQRLWVKDYQHVWAALQVRSNREWFAFGRHSTAWLVSLLNAVLSVRTL